MGEVAAAEEQHPWFGPIVEAGLDEMKPVFRHCYDLSRAAIKQLLGRTMLDIGCGAVGKYVDAVLNKPGLEVYVGIDIDVAKLRQGLQKVHNSMITTSATTVSSPTCHFFKVDCCEHWDAQMQPTTALAVELANDCRVEPNSPFDLICSIFAFQYANATSESWDLFVGEINQHSKPGTIMFIEWIDADRINRDGESCRYVHLVEEAGSGASAAVDSGKGCRRGTLAVSLPHRPLHEEPLLRWSHIDDAFIKHGGWQVDAALTASVASAAPEFDKKLPLWEYVRLVNTVVLVKGPYSS